MKRVIKGGGLVIALIAIIGGATVLSQVNTSALDRLVGSGQTIQSVIDAANPGDKVIIPAGSYNESLTIYNKTDVEIIGQGEVVINSQPNLPSDTARKGIAIVDSSGVTLRNLVVDGSATPTVGPDWATGIDVVGGPNLTIDSVIVRNFGKNGIAINGSMTNTHQVSGAPADLVTSNVTLSNVTVEKAGWAGIAFYGIDRNDTSKRYNMEGIVFTGTTTITDTQYGIQFGSSDDPSIATGPSGQPIDLGTVRFANNVSNVSNDAKNVPLTISATSTINGNPITAADFSGLNVTIEAAQVPGVPNTGIVRQG